MKFLLQQERKRDHAKRLLIYLLTKYLVYQTPGEITNDIPTTNLKIQYPVKNMYIYHNLAMASYKVGR